MECALKQKLKMNAPKYRDWFIGEVVATHVDDEILDADRRIDLRKTPFIV